MSSLEGDIMKCKNAGIDCNECMTNCRVLHKTTYKILYKLYLTLGDEIHNTTQNICPNLTVCPECRLDDFSHFMDCQLASDIENEVKK